MKKATSRPAPKRKKTKIPSDSESRYRDLFAHMSEGFALCKMKFNGKTPLDFQYIAVNAAFEKQTGLKNVEGRWVSEVIPGLLESDPELFAIYGRVVQTGKPEKFEMKVAALDMWFSMSVYRPEKDHFVAVFDVIADRKLAEKALLASEERYRRITDAVTDYIYTVRVRDGKPVETIHSATCEAVTGYSAEDFLREPELWIHIVHPEDREAVLQQAAQTLSGEKTDSLEHRIIRKDGVTRWVRSIQVPHQDDRGSLASYDGLISDATERKQAEKNLRKSEEEFRTLFHTMAQGVVYQDASGQIISANPAAEKILGVSLDQLQGRTSMDPRWKAVREDGSHFPGEEHPIPVALRTGREVRNVIHGVFNPQSGETRWINVNATPQFRPGEDRPYQAYATIEDITERKRAAIDLEKSEHRFAATFHKNNVAMTIAEVGSGRFLDVNEVFCQTVGFLKSELVGKSAAELGIFRDSAVRRAFVNPAIANGFAKDIEVEFYRRDGRKLCGSFSGSVIELENKAYLLATEIDITERKRIESALRESESNLREAQRIGKMGNWINDVEKGNYTWGDETYHLFGYTRENAPSTDEIFRRHLLPEDYDSYFQTIRKKYADLSQPEFEGVEIRIRRTDGEMRYLTASGEFFTDPAGQRIGARGVLQDITERKLAEIALNESEERFRSILENTEAGYFFMDTAGIIRDVNPAWVRLYRYDSAAEILGRHFAAVQQEEDVQGANNIVAGILRGETRYTSGEFSRKCKDGSIGYHSFSARPVSRKGEIVGLEGFIIDITERKQAEIELKKSEEKYRNLFNNAEIGMYRTKLDGSLILDFNDQYLKIFGRTRAEMQSGPSRIYWADPVERVEFVRRLKIEGHIADFECRMVTKTGLERICITSARLYPDQEILEGSIIDITDRKNAERALLESETKYRTLFESMQEGMALHQLVRDSAGNPIDYILLEVNGAFEQTIGMKRSEVLGKRATEVYGTADAPYLQQYVGVAQGGETLRFETYFQPLSRYYDISVISPKKDQFATIFLDVTERKKSEELVRESEARFRLIFESAPVAINITRGMDIVYANPCYLAMFGLASMDELAALRPVELFAPEWRSRIVEKIQRRDTGLGAPTSYEAECLRKDGTKFRILMYLARSIFADGPATVAFVIDITERQQAEEALRSAKEYVENLIQTANSIVVGLDKNGEVQIFNEAAEAITGYSQAELAHKNWFETIVPRDLYPKVWEEFQKLSEHGLPKILENPIRTKQGEERFITWQNSEVMDHGEVVGTISFGLDITDRRRAEESLRQKTALLEAQLNSTLDGIIVVDEQRRKVLQNRRTVELWEIPAEVADNPDDTAQVQHVMRMMKNPEEFVAKVNYLYDHPQETSREEVDLVNGTILDRYSAPVLGEDGRNYGRIWVFRDITERRRAEDEFRALNESLERRVTERTANLEAANREMETFAYSISHDLRAPLRAIDGYMKILMDENGPNLDEGGQKMGQVIRENAKRMGRQIDELLELSRVSRREIRCAQVNMEELIHAVVEELSTPDDLRRIDFHIDALPFADADPTSMHELWTNLISNAIKFSGKKERAVIQVRGEIQDKEVVYSIQDNGAGFEMEYVGKLFGVFQRLHSLKEFEGTGVGLAIAQRLVVRNGGRIWAVGKPEEGATFSFSLPRRTAS